MLRKLTIAAAAVLMLTIVESRGAQESASEDAKSRPDKQEIIGSMLKAAQMPAQEQTRKLDSILQNPSGSQTPRSDFMFCIGLAYSGNDKAQKCVGSAYEGGRGVVEDLSEAYTWYAIALENQPAGRPAEQSAEADKERVKMRLLAAYPHPSEDDLDDMVNTQKTLIAQYREDVKRAKR